MPGRILVIDDDPINVMLINSILKEVDYEVISAFDGLSGLDMAKKQEPDLIMVDWTMPDKSGIEVVKELKSNPTTKGIPAIMITGMMTSVENMLQAFEAGVIDFIRKPYEKLELIARTKSILLLSEYFKEKLEANKKELISITMRLVESNEFNNELLRRIGEIRKRYTVHSTMLLAEINELEYLINSRQKGDLWQRFEEYFRMVNPNFSSNLLMAHPGLSPAEIKLCSLLRLGISTKEISVLLFQNIDSVRVARTRLRKKLGLDSEDNLVTYLLAI